MFESVDDNASAVDQNTGVAYSAVRSNDNGDSFSDSNPADEPVSPRNTHTIQDVYNDVDQSECGVETVMNSIRNERLKEFVKTEKGESLRGSALNTRFQCGEDGNVDNKCSSS
jgi:hypothetical protein